MENWKLILGFIVAIIGAITAIFQLKKAYIEWKSKKSKGAGGTQMNNLKNNTKIKDSSIDIGNTTNTDSNNITINGNVSINDSSDKKSPSLQSMDENIILKDIYTSLFAENGRIKTEKITINNLGSGKIEGQVYLDNQNTYTLTGTFKNRVLTGEFTSVGRYNDERGTINLKLISENILSGFCSFSKTSMLEADHIRMSPYVWVAGNDENLVNGTYEFCTQCHNDNKQCCCASEDIDMPILLFNEAQKIHSQHPRAQIVKDFSHNIEQTNIRQMNIKETNDNGKTVTHCHFYDLRAKKCKIYDTRPTDCRLFPFDIKLDPNTQEFWVGYYDELCDRKLPDEEKMKEYAHILRPQLFLLLPYSNIINRKDVCEKLSNAHFNKLYKLNEFVF